MKTKMIVAAMALLLAVAFGAFVSEDSEAAAGSTMAGYGETTTAGITDIAEYWEYIDDNTPANNFYYLELKLESTNPEQVFIYVDYTDSTHYAERQGLYSISSEMTVILNNKIASGKHTIDIYTKSGTEVVSIPIVVYADQTITISAENTADSVAAKGVFAGGTVSAASIEVKQGQAIAVDGTTVTIGSQEITATPAVATPTYEAVFDHWVIFGADGTGYPTAVPAAADPATIVAYFKVTYVCYTISASAAPGTNSTGLDISDVGTISAPAKSGTGEENGITYEATVTVAAGVLTITSADNKTVIYTASSDYTSDKYTATFAEWQIDGADFESGVKITADSTITALYTIDLKPIAVTIGIAGEFETVKNYAKTIVSTGTDPAINWTAPAVWTNATFYVPYGSVVVVKDGVLTIKDLRTSGSSYEVTATPKDADDNYVYSAAWQDSTGAEIIEGTKVTSAVTYNVLFSQANSAYIKINAGAYASESTFSKITGINVASNTSIKAGNDVTLKITYTDAAAAAAETKGYTYTFYKAAYSAELPATADYGSATEIGSANVVSVAPGVYVIKGITASSTILVKATPFANVGDNVSVFYIKGISGNQITTVIESKDSSLIGSNEVRYNVSYKFNHPVLSKEVYSSASCTKLSDTIKDASGDEATALADGKAYHTVVSTLSGTTTRAIFSAQALYTDSSGNILVEGLWATA
jgi:hypothetical protein